MPVISYFMSRVSLSVFLPLVILLSSLLCCNICCVMKDQARHWVEREKKTWCLHFSSITSWERESLPSHPVVVSGGNILSQWLVSSITRETERTVIFAIRSPPSSSSYYSTEITLLEKILRTQFEIFSPSSSPFSCFSTVTPHLIIGRLSSWSLCLKRTKIKQQQP